MVICNENYPVFLQLLISGDECLSQEMRNGFMKCVSISVYTKRFPTPSTEYCFHCYVDFDNQEPLLVTRIN